MRTNIQKVVLEFETYIHPVVNAWEERGQVGFEVDLPGELRIDTTDLHEQVCLQAMVKGGTPELEEIVEKTQLCAKMEGNELILSLEDEDDV